MTESIHSQLTLVVDASGTPIQIGLPTANGWARLENEPGQAMEGIFRLVHLLFDSSDLRLDQVTTLYYCEGPGSTLGLRLAATFVKTLLWNGKGKVRLFQYNALDLAALIPDSEPASLQAPFRRGRRFVRTPGASASLIGNKKIIDEENALSEYPDSLHLPDNRTSLLELPESSMLPYDLSAINGLNDLKKISVPADEPQPYSPEPMVFKKWEPTIRPD
jgi:tRNA A37 threonylcarbamoyladenosine modification protein TsaB